MKYLSPTTLRKFSFLFLNLLLFQYNKLEKEYNDNEYRLNSYKDMKKELSLYNDKYDDMEFIKRSLSSKEGIPLLYIQIYLH